MNHYNLEDEVERLEWECLSDVLEITIREPGVLPHGMEFAEIKRAEDLSILLTAHTPGRASQPTQKTRPGELIPEPPPTVGVTRYGTTVELRGVWLKEQQDSMDAGSRAIAAAEFVREDAETGEPHRLAEWLVNYSTDDKVHPRNTDRLWVRQFTRTRDGQAPVHLDLSPKSIGFWWDHMRLALPVNGKTWVVTVGRPPRSKDRDRFHPGFVEFDCSDGVPSEDTRASIIDALSFSMGRRIISIGGCTFDSATVPIAREMRFLSFLRDPHIFSNPNIPPAPFWREEEEKIHLIDEDCVQASVSAVLQHMDALNLRHLFRLYWAASLSFIQQAVIELAAALESLRDSFLSRSAGKGGVLRPDEWTRIKAALVEQFDAVTSGKGLSDKPRDVAILRNRVLGLNYKSSRERFDEFFLQIRLPVGKVEREALRRRNLPAHGHEGNAAVERALVLTNYALRTLFHRVVLKLTGAADRYIDYSTYGFPLRPVDEPLGGPKGDGEPAPLE